MNKKGFTFVELLAVIVILSIITTLTVVSYKHYAKQAREDELIALRGTVESAYNNYRSKMLYTNGKVYNEVTFGFLVENNYIPKNFNYNDVKFSANDLSDSKIKVVTKGEMLNETYLNGGSCNFTEMIKYGICKTDTDDSSVTVDEKTGTVVGSTDDAVFCLTEDASSATANYCRLDNGKKVFVVPSEDEAYCLYVKHTNNGTRKELINDFLDCNKPYCMTKELREQKCK